MPKGKKRGEVLNFATHYTQKRLKVLSEISSERGRQDERFGEQTHPDGTGSVEDMEMAESVREVNDATDPRLITWADILMEEVYEALAEADKGRLRAELIQVAAVAVNWIEAIDRENYE